MTRKTQDLLAIGNAIVDVIARQDDAFISSHGLEKGGMTLIDAPAAEKLYGDLDQTVSNSGGSAANSAAAFASLGGSVEFVGKVRDDELGHAFTHDLRSTGVKFEASPAVDGPPSGHCMVMVTPDAERTMATCLGIATSLNPADIDEDAIARSRYIFLEGYLFDSPSARDACLKAITLAKLYSTQIVLTLSDAGCVERHKGLFSRLVRNFWIDVLFANETEINALFGSDSVEEAAEDVAASCSLAILTQSEKGSLIVSGNNRLRVAAESLGKAVDTTGAGDLYAAGFLYGLSQDKPLEECGRIAALVAAESVTHLGARAQHDLKDLVQDKAA